MTSLAIQPIAFSFQETHDVRIQMIDGEPWFCLKDVCEVLTIANSRRVASEVLDQDGVRKAYITDSLGRDQEAAFVNEPNLYRVIFRSNKPEAKQFQDWVFNEVLPTIRKTGRYQVEETRQQVPVFRYVITLHYRDVVTGQEETLKGGCNSPEEIVRGTAKKFGIFIPEMLNMPVNSYY